MNRATTKYQEENQQRSGHGKIVSINKTDFITPLSGPFTNPFIIKENQKINKSIFDSNLYNFTEDEQFINPERYESQYEIYLENKRIDEIFDESDNSSNYSYGSE